MSRTEGGTLLYAGTAALLAWVAARVVLGTDWDARVLPGGRLVDGVSLTRWATFWLLLASLGTAAATQLRGALVAVLVIAPTVAWLAARLWGPLGPIPLVVYLVPTTAVWFGALASGVALRRRLARSVNH